MRTDHVSLTLFAWEGTPGAAHHTAAAARGGGGGGDADAEGHALFGSATPPAADNEPGLIRSFGPPLTGRNPAGRERLEAGFRSALRGDMPAGGGTTARAGRAHLAEAPRLGSEIRHGSVPPTDAANLHAAISLRNTT